jgi:hypothetical protein
MFSGLLFDCYPSGVTSRGLKQKIVLPTICDDESQDIHLVRNNARVLRVTIAENQ